MFQYYNRDGVQVFMVIERQIGDEWLMRVKRTARDEEQGQPRLRRILERAGR